MSFSGTLTSPALSSVLRKKLRRAGTEEPTTRLKEDLRRRCAARVAAQRAALVQQRRQQHGGGGSDEMEEALATELRWSGGCSRTAPLPAPHAWSEADEARLQQQLGREGYLELMAATEEALLRELESDVAGLDSGPCFSETAAVSEYEEFLAAEEAAAAEQMALAGAGGDVGIDVGVDVDVDAVLCPLCFRAGLVTCDGWVTCPAQCGLRLDARGAADGSDPIELLRWRLNTLHSDHGRRCTAGPGGCRMPLPAEQAALGLLAFGCDVCGYCARVV